MKAEPKVVLLVEDEPLLGELMTEALTEKGFAVVAATDARGALHHLLSGGDCDLLFTDIDLGAGMDGATLAQLVHAIRPGLPIVYTSGRRSLQDFATVPGAAFLPKPYSLSDVDRTLAQKLGEARKPGETAQVIPPSRRAPGTAPASGCDNRR
jgi:DNA-binding NtrC family response regulator